jgi:alpha-glucosidase (family GH31 glycosyl hydrolase)
MEWSIFAIGALWPMTEHKANFRRLGLLAVVLFVIATVIFPVGLIAQTQPFSSTAEYRLMLEELHRQSAIPSRISAGTLLASSSKAMAPVKAEETAALLSVETDAWRLEVSKGSWGIALTNKQTGLTWQLARSDSSVGGLLWDHGVDGRPATTLRPMKVEHIERRGNEWRMQVKVEGSNEPADMQLTVISPTVIRLSIQAPQSGSDTRMRLNFTGAGPFFGLGERFDRVKLDGLNTSLRPEDHFGKPGHNWTYIPVPFLLTPRGLGIYLDTAAVTTFDLSDAAQERFSIQVDRPSVDSYFFVGTPKSIIEDYTLLTGRTPLSPPWAFGVWICSYQGPRQVLDDARKLREEKIPSSAIWTFDVMGQGDIMGWPLWRTGYYPNPREFTDKLHSMGFKALTYVHPYLRSVLAPYNLPSPPFVAGSRSGLMVLNSQGKPTGPAKPFAVGYIDFTSPANVHWWEQKIRDIVLKDNFDGWMEDYGESVKYTDRFAAGVTGREMANLYPLFYHKITYEISRKFKPDVVEFDRSGYAGSQGYTPVVWGGDQRPDWTQDHGLPSVVRGGITAGLSGFAIWGPDIEGNGFSKELWARWVEFGALTPIMRNHLWSKPYGAVDLWYDSQTVGLFRSYAQLHISLFPYLYTYAQEAAKDGLPVMRHPLLEFPNDPKAYDTEAEYLLGEKILVAPVVEQGATSRSLYLPKGSWVNYWTGKIIEGGQQITVAAPLEQIPILIRSGSILPFINPETQTLAENLPGKNSSLTRNLTWRVFPASGLVQDNFTLYDGTTAVANQSSSEISVGVEHSPEVREYEIVLPMTEIPRAVTVAGKPLSKLDDEGYQSHESGWRLNRDDGTLHVFFEGDDFKLHVAK